MTPDALHNAWLDDLRVFKREYGRGAQSYLAAETGVSVTSINGWLRNDHWALYPHAMAVSRAVAAWRAEQNIKQMADESRVGARHARSMSGGRGTVSYETDGGD